MNSSHLMMSHHIIEILSAKSSPRFRTRSVLADTHQTAGVFQNIDDEKAAADWILNIYSVHSGPIFSRSVREKLLSPNYNHNKNMMTITSSLEKSASLGKNGLLMT